MVRKEHNCCKVPREHTGTRAATYYKTVAISQVSCKLIISCSRILKESFGPGLRKKSVTGTDEGPFALVACLNVFISYQRIAVG